MTDCWAWLNDETEKDFLAQCYTGEEMYITAPQVYRTSKERNEDYKGFMESLAKCESRAAIASLKMEYHEMFTKLRNEKAEGYDYHGFDYLEELATAIEKQRELIGEYTCL